MGIPKSAFNVRNTDCLYITLMTPELSITWKYKPQKFKRYFNGVQANLCWLCIIVANDTCNNRHIASFQAVSGRIIWGIWR